VAPIRFNRVEIHGRVRLQRRSVPFQRGPLVPRPPGHPQPLALLLIPSSINKHPPANTHQLQQPSSTTLHPVANHLFFDQPTTRMKSPRFQTSGEYEKPHRMAKGSGNSMQAFSNRVIGSLWVLSDADRQTTDR